MLEHPSFTMLLTYYLHNCSWSSDISIALHQKSGRLSVIFDCKSAQ